MEFRFLFEKVLDDNRVKGLLEKDYFLSSCFCMPTLCGNSVAFGEWTINFYNPAKNMIVSVVTDGEDVAVEEPDEAQNRMKKLAVDDGVIEPSEVVAKLLKDVKGVTSILTTLHTKDNDTIWTVAFVLRSMDAISYDIDAKTGKKLREEKESLVTRVSRAM